MVGNAYRWRAVIPQLENRNSTAGCLLALLFFVPLFAKTFHISLEVIILFIVIYVSIIVPIGTGIISKKYIIGRIRKFSSLIFDDQQWNFYMTQLSYISSWVHYIYLQVDGVQTFTTQMTFNIAAEKLFCPKQRFSSLYVLLFYCFLAYIQRSLQERPWAQIFNGTSTTEFLKLTTAFVIVRLGKGVAVTLVLLTFSYQFNNLQPTYTFIVTTFIYFLITQYQNSYFFKNILVDWLTKLELQCLDGLEEHWVPVLTHLLTIGFSLFVFMGMIIHTNNFVILIILGYINFSIPLKYSLQPAWEILVDQKAVISRFSLVTWNNPQVCFPNRNLKIYYHEHESSTMIRGGYPCPVCLDKMRILSARITPCGHVFHGSCLRKCLQHSKQCPLCKTLL